MRWIEDRAATPIQPIALSELNPSLNLFSQFLGRPRATQEPPRNHQGTTQEHPTASRSHPGLVCSQDARTASREANSFYNIKKSIGSGAGRVARVAFFAVGYCPGSFFKKVMFW